MAAKKIIAVVGATGAQGGGLARAILADRRGPFVARALAASGAEVGAADVDELASLQRAFAGAHGAFCVTFYWAHSSPERELAQARNLAQAAKDTGLRHVVWSTLEDTRKWVPLADDRMPTLMGKYKVPHFDAKGEANQLFSDLGVPTTFLLTSFFWDNFIYFGMRPKKTSDGQLAITLPMGDKKLPGIAAEDIGRCALGILKAGREYIGKTVAIAGECLTGTQIAAALSRALGRPVGYNAVTPESYRSFGFPGAEDLGNMFQFKRDFENYFSGVRKPEVARSLNPALQTFEAWLAKNKDRIPVD